MSEFTHAGGVVVRAGAGGAAGEGSRVLLVKSRDGRHWVLPKGHIDPGETAEEAAVREVREEAGVVAEIVSRLGIDAYSLAQEEVRALFFLMRFCGETAADEERALHWLPLPEAAATIEFPGSRALLEEAGRRLATLTAPSFDTLDYNRHAWDRQVAAGNLWTRPVSADVIEAARQGSWTVGLISLRAAPREWFPDDITGLEILCLASGGGQQGPVLAAAGAKVTVFDNSPAQLARDREVADTHGLKLRSIQGDMADLRELRNQSFDLVFHPVSNVFVPDVRPVWHEAFRVLRRGGRLLAGFMNPAVYLFDNERFDRDGERIVRYALPYSDLRDLPPAELAAKQKKSEPLEFGHSLADLVGGQLDAGFVLTGFDECARSEAEWSGPLQGYMPEYVATCAVKPR